MRSESRASPYVFTIHETPPSLKRVAQMALEQAGQGESALGGDGVLPPAREGQRFPTRT